MDDDEQSLVGWLVRLLIGCTDEAHDWLDPSLIVADPIRLLVLSQAACSCLGKKKVMCLCDKPTIFSRKFVGSSHKHIRDPWLNWPVGWGMDCADKGCRQDVDGFLRAVIPCIYCTELL